MYAEERQQAMAELAAAREVVVLAEASKVGVEASMRFAAVADVGILITDTGIDRDHHRDLSDAGLEVRVA